jgi:hypothetical protein
MEWLALLIHIGDILGSDLFLETRYHDFFHGFPSSRQANSGIASDIKP